MNNNQSVEHTSKPKLKLITGSSQGIDQGRNQSIGLGKGFGSLANAPCFEDALDKMETTITDKRTNNTSDERKTCTMTSKNSSKPAFSPTSQKELSISDPDASPSKDITESTLA